MILEGVQRFFESEFGIACAIGLGVLVIGWLAVSFMAPGPGRRPVEWTAALGLYVALFAFFSYQALHAWHGDNHVRLAAFGLLTALFGSGAVVAVVRLVGSFGTSTTDSGGATN